MTILRNGSHGHADSGYENPNDRERRNQSPHRANVSSPHGFVLLRHRESGSSPLGLESDRTTAHCSPFDEVLKVDTRSERPERSGGYEDGTSKCVEADVFASVGFNE